MKKIPSHVPQDSCKPEISYPCLWQYKLIGQDRNQLLEAIKQCVTESPYTLNDSNTSSGGKYVSMSLELTVNDEPQRLKFYRDFAAHAAVKVVL